MFVVGLTGGIGSGKSTVADLFLAQGIPVIDTDQLARDLTQPTKPALKKITDLFGSEIVSPNGHLNRSKLKKMVFSDEIKRKKLEDILHPLIRAEMEVMIESFDAPYCIAMIPLLFETSVNPLINRVLVVDTPEELQISRTIARDNISSKEIEAILKTQVSRQHRLDMTDDVIVNDGIYDDLIPQVKKLHELYLSLA